MADKLHRHIMIAIKIGFEWQQRQHQIDTGTNALDPALAPGPHRRRHIMGGTNTGGAQAALNRQIEVRRINADADIRLLLKQEVHKLTAQAKQLRQTAQHFGDSHHRQPLHREKAVQALLGHQGATDTNKTNIRITLTQRRHQTGTENIAGLLAGDQCNEWRGVRHDQRVMPRSDARSESINSCSSALAGMASSSAIACSSVRPWR